MAERQTAPTVAGIRADHSGRYRWAAGQIEKGALLLDAACGVGYGAWLLADAGHLVVAADRSQEALAYGMEHYHHGCIDYLRADLPGHVPLLRYDAAVCFETLEHVEDAAGLLRMFAERAPRLLCSVPNETELPFSAERFPFHVRHYRADELEALLLETGWQVAAWYHQATAHSAVPAAGIGGRTLIVDARRVA